MDGTGITLDDRVGSRHYSLYLPGCTVARLDSGDAAWLAHDGKLVGAEIKTIGDAVNCMYSGRLADAQIPLMRETYDFSYLIVEGIWRADPQSGILQRYKGELGKWGSWYDVVTGQKRLLYSAFANWLETLSQWGGVSLRSAPDPPATASLLRSLCNWWQRSHHQSFEVLHSNNGDSASLARPTVLRRIASQLPHIGWERSRAVVEKFRSVEAMVQASTEDWCEIKGIGKKIAHDVMGVLHEDET